MLDPQPGEQVLDLCAAPGIKTTAIAARMANRGNVVAVERDPGRAGQLAELCARLGATSVTVVEGDAAELDLGGGYDRVLVDPPCSDLGTLASRPDARWRKSPELIERAGRHPGAPSPAGPSCPGAGRDARLLDLHDLPARGRGPRRGARCPRRGGGGRPRRLGPGACLDS